MTAVRYLQAPNPIAREMELSPVSVELWHGFRWSHQGKHRNCQ